MTPVVPATPEECALVAALAANYPALNTATIIERNTVGAANKTLIITTPSHKFALRESNDNTTDEHLAFEIEVFDYFAQQGETMTPHVIRTIDGLPLARLNGKRYMLQNFIPGDIIASWESPEALNPAQFDDLYRTCARFSKRASSFRPSRTYTLDSLPKVLSSLETEYDRLSSTLPNSPGKDMIIGHRGALFAFAAATKKGLDELGYASLPRQLVHFDMHPGNFHFSGSKVVGIFDFDWACMDSRFAELAGMICQTCYDISTTKNGTYDKEKIRRGLTIYREAFGQSEYSAAFEDKIIALCLRAFLSVQMLWLIGWYTRHYNDPKALFIAEYWTLKMSAVNDFDDLFDIKP